MELIIVLFIIGMVVGIGVPRFLDSLRKAELKTSAGKLSAAMRSARAKAISRKGTVTLVVDNVKRRIYAVHGRMTAESDASDGEQNDTRRKPMAPPLEIPEGITVWDDTGEKKEELYVLFLPIGTSSGGKYFITPADSLLHEDEDAYVVTLDPISGKTRVDAFAEMEKRPW